MNRIPCFDSALLEAVCRVLADTSEGLTGPEIGAILADMAVADTHPAATKWKRLFNALACVQHQHQLGNHVIMFINRAMAPAKYVRAPEMFQWRQDNLNVALSLAGFGVNERGQVITTTREMTVAGAVARAKRLQSKLEGRGTHAQVFVYCRAELLTDNYFHAVLEAVKGVAERIRQMSGLASDGAELVNQSFSTKTPILAISSLKTETELSEQKGFSNLLIGLFGAIRNPIAHAPKVSWPMPEQDALDIFALVSFVHRKLDVAVKL
ncbi:TIGR02391 family protein [Rhizobacter sp. LjRoot28]|uniref:TIGR02391 family protein n=1 Tax=Rhizobacter sp. LjRoot28 TaxID=3342309 RepID=UPI003ED00A25